jgi:hypothetical protein
LIVETELRKKKKSAPKTSTPNIDTENLKKSENNINSIKYITEMNLKIEKAKKKKTRERYERKGNANRTQLI